MRRRVSTILMTGLLAGGFGAACGGGDDERMAMPAPPPPAAVAPAEEVVEEEESVETRVAAMMATNDRATFAIDTRDPFSQPRPEVTIGSVEGGGPIIDCFVDEQPLGQTEVADLELIGLITGTAIPRAMFLAVGTRQAVMATEGDLIGPNCTNRITNIRDNEVVIEPHTVGETAASIVVLALNDERLSQRFIRIEDE